MDENENMIVQKFEKNEKNLEKSKNDFWFGLSLPGRLLFTVYSLHGLFFIYNFIIQYLVLFPSLLYTGEISNWAKIPFSCIYFAFAIFSSNLLVIPTFEFFTFPFLFYKNPFLHIISFKYIYKGQKFNEKEFKHKPNFIMIIFFLVIGALYIISVILSYASISIKFKDYIKIGILIFIYSYYLVIIFCYFSFSFFLIVIILKNIRGCKSIEKIINLYFGDKPEIPNVNLFSHIINPFINKNYTNGNNKQLNQFDDNDSCSFENCYYKSISAIKILSIFFSIYCFIVFLCSLLNYWVDYLFFILFFVILAILSITLNFPIFYRNIKTFGFWICCKKDGVNNSIISTNIQYNLKIKHPYVVSCSRFISNLIFFLASIGFIYIYFLRKENDIYQDSKFKAISANIKKIDTKNILLPNMCYSSIHNMPLQLFMPFINDAYYYGKIKSDSGKAPESSFNINEYKKLFFDDNYEIEILGNLVKKDNTVKMIQYNINNKKNYLTILSIKGTSYNTDIYIDAQLYFSSILLNILSTFSLITQKDSLTFNLIEYSLNIPYRIFFRFLLIDNYMTDLKNAFIENEYSFYNHVVIVGHSLGGGLAKLFGRYMGKQAISLSGPGINAFYSLWNFKGTSENFEISNIDLVPDMDLVPRIEVSGGTVYRIICKNGAGKCHGKELSLCEVLIMCRNPIYENYCKEFAGLNDEQIKQIIESSELNN